MNEITPEQILMDLKLASPLPTGSMAHRLCVADDIVANRSLELSRIWKMYEGLAALGVTLKLGTALAFSPMSRLHEAKNRANDLGMRAFLDTKLDDNPTAVEKAVQGIIAMGFCGFTYHAGMSLACLENVMLHRGDALACGVTIPTSCSAYDCWRRHGNSDREMVTLQLARDAHHAGSPGIVCSPYQLDALHARGLIGPGKMKTVTPGIDFAGVRHDHDRTMHPADAIRAGADYLVVGRPIVESPDPIGMTKRFLDAMETATANRSEI